MFPRYAHENISYHWCVQTKVTGQKAFSMRNAWLHQRTYKELRGRRKVDQLSVNTSQLSETHRREQNIPAKSVQVCGQLTLDNNTLPWSGGMRPWYSNCIYCVVYERLHFLVCTFTRSTFTFKFSLTSTLSSADQRWSRWPSSSLSRSGEENADTVFSVWFQMPNFVGERADSMSLRPRRMAGPVHDLPTNHRPVSHYGVCVQLNDQVRGAWAKQLGWGYWGGWN